MKKYIKPEMEIVNVKIQSLLVDGSVIGLQGVNRGGDYGGGSVDSRGGGDWDDED